MTFVTSFFIAVSMKRSTFCGSSELRAECGGVLQKEHKFFEAKSADTSIASRSRQSPIIGFQDSLDAILLAMMPSCWAFKANL